VRLEVHPGEALAVLGGNGAGKTALLLSMAGLLPTRGERRVAGQRVRTVSEAVRAGLSLVLQDPDDQLLGPAVLDDVSFGPRNLGLDLAAARQRALDALVRVGMHPHADRLVHTLSFGERKRVALAAALAMEPRVLLLDEPTAGLDPRCEVAMADLLRSLRRDGVALVVSTHAVDLVPLYAERVAVLDGGAVWLGSCRALFADETRLTRAGLRRPWVAQGYIAAGGAPASAPLTLAEVTRA
jgi:cobalt/nickel transport system ATP-binding protein